MLPSVPLHAGSSAECILLVALACTAGASAVVAFGRAWPERSLLRWAALIATYLCATLALMLVAHALAGRGAWVVSSYAVMLVISVLIAWALVVPRLTTMGLPLQLVFYMIFGCLLLGILGSRVAHALSELAYGAPDVELVAQLVDRSRAGLGIFGAIAVDLLFLVVLFRLHPEHSLARSLDASTPAIALNVAVGRIGCLLAGCCYGAVVEPNLFSMPVAAFARDSPAGAAYRELPDASIWATQLLEMMAVFAIAGACELLYRRRRQLGLRDGTVIAFAAASYGGVRGLLELLRADSARPFAGQFTIWQVLSLALCGATLGWLMWASRSRPARRPA